MSSMKQSTYIEEALRRIDSEIFAEPNQMKIILQKELQGLGERILDRLQFSIGARKNDYDGGYNQCLKDTIDLIRSLTLPKS